MKKVSNFGRQILTQTMVQRSRTTEEVYWKKNMSQTRATFYSVRFKSLKIHFPLISDCINAMLLSTTSALTSCWARPRRSWCCGRWCSWSEACPRGWCGAQSGAGTPETSHKSVMKPLCKSVSHLRKVETVLGQLGADEVLGNLDTVVQVSDLNWVIFRLH